MVDGGQLLQSFAGVADHLPRATRAPCVDCGKEAPPSKAPRRETRSKLEIHDLCIPLHRCSYQPNSWRERRTLDLCPVAGRPSKWKNSRMDSDFTAEPLGSIQDTPQVTAHIHPWPSRPRSGDLELKMASRPSVSPSVSGQFRSKMTIYPPFNTHRKRPCSSYSTGGELHVCFF